MSFDEGLAQRICEALEEPVSFDITEKKMFGGLAFLQKGHMFCGIIGEKLMVRCGPGNYEESLKRNHVTEMNFTGRPMKGYVYVSPEGIENDTDLEYWISISRQFAKTLKPKTGKPNKRR